MTIPLVSMIDPERITARVFGGPHFGLFKPDGPDAICSLDGRKRWLVTEVRKAWAEGRNAVPEITAARLTEYTYEETEGDEQ